MFRFVKLNHITLQHLYELRSICIFENIIYKELDLHINSEKENPCITVPTNENKSKPK